LMAFRPLRSPAFPQPPWPFGLNRAAFPSCVFAPLQGFLSSASLVASPRQHLSGLSYRSAYAFRRSPRTLTRPTAPVKVRVQGFSPSSQFAPPSALRVCFTPQTPFGFTLQGFPLLRSSPSSSLGPCRLAVGPSVALPLLASGSSGDATALSRKAQSVLWADFAALLPEKVRSVQQAGLALTTGRAPPGLCRLRGMPSFAMPRLVAAAPAMRFGLRQLHRVAPIVLPPAALRGVTRLRGVFASLEADFPP